MLLIAVPVQCAAQHRMRLILAFCSALHRLKPVSAVLNDDYEDVSH